MFQIDPTHDAIIIIDVQSDFCPGGALAVTNGDHIIPPLNSVLNLNWKKIIGTRDWHPLDHHSFVTQGGPWPVHCVQNSPGSFFHSQINSNRFNYIIDAGQNADDPGYSKVENTDLVSYLQEQSVTRPFVGGLATDYCVKNTVLDLCKNGFNVVLLTDCVKAVNINPDDGEKALSEMQKSGAVFTTSRDLLGN